MNWLAIAGMVISLFLIPLGLPGLWIMIGILAVGAIYKMVGVLTLLVVVALAGIAELLEFIYVKRYTDKYGGSRKAFWGALAGGLIGVFVGAPIPIVGSIIAGFIGTFLGAYAVTFAETRNTASASRVGYGVVLGRAVAAIAKTFAGLVILVLGVAAFLV